MLWGAPYSFLFLVGILPAIFILHGLRPKGARIKMATMFLLERVLIKRPANEKIGFFFKKNLLLLLQILIAVVLITALADPFLVGYGNPAGDIVVVLDLSASMKAQGNTSSRFDEARKELLDLIDAKPRDKKIMIIGAGPRPKVLRPFTADKSELQSLAYSLVPTDGPGHVKEAVFFAHSFLRQGSEDRILVLSDGAFDGFQNLPWNSTHLRLIRVGKLAHNIGIMSFEFRRVRVNPGEVEILVAIKNFTDRTVRTPLTVMVNDQTLVREEIEINAGERRVMIYPFKGFLRGRARAFLGLKDDFSTDNQAYLILSEPSTIRLLYVGEGNIFLEQLLRSFPRVEFTRLSEKYPKEFTSQIQKYDIVVFDGTSPPPSIEGNIILINSFGAGLPYKVKGEVLHPRPLPVVKEHPISKGLRLDNLYIKEALHLTSLKNGVVLARSEETPLIVAFESGRLRALVVGFDILSSDLPFRVAFPILISNALSWFRLGEPEFPATYIRAGNSMNVPINKDRGQVEIRYPSGKRERIETTTATLNFPGTTQVGFYNYRSGDNRGEFAVNLFDETESKINLEQISDWPSDVKLYEENGEEIREGIELWTFLLALALFLLLLEAFLAFRENSLLNPLLLRLPVLLAILVALINPRVTNVTEALDVIIGMDFSRSVGQEGKNKTLDILRKVQRFKGPSTRVGLVSFGDRPSWEFLPNVDIPLSDFSPSVGRGSTDIASALQSALAHLGEGREGRILLISDGNENLGDVSQVAPLLKTYDVPVWVYPVSFSKGTNEVYLRNLVLPYRVDSAETFEIKLAVESLHEAPARIKLLRDGFVKKEVKSVLKPGTNWISLNETLNQRGIHNYEVVVESSKDTLAENNLLQGVVEVKGPPRVLYLRSFDNPHSLMVRALRVQGYEVEEMSIQENKLTLSKFSAFDLIVLDNIPAYSLSQSEMEAIEKYVKDLGGGLIVLGGTNSYGAGGYYRTPLERLLPVNMRPPARLELPHVALLYVLDKSGSMGSGPQGFTKLDLAKAAALASAELLNPADQIGILAFDADWDWAIPFSKVGKGEWISEHISSLESDGGTDLLKAMNEAYRSISSNEAAVKHILVLSDGLTDKANFQSLIRQMVQDGITVSTVSVGRDSDLTLMKEIATIGKGRGYVTIDPRTIPQIFTTETLLISRDLLIDKIVQPRIKLNEGSLKGFAGKELPYLRGYVLTHPKPSSAVLMTVNDDPLLVSWRYGLGNVLAFTSDLTARWGRDWVGWKEFPRWTSQLARSAMRKVSDRRMKTEFRLEGEKVKILVDYFSSQGRPLNHLALRGIVTGPDRTTQEKQFRQIAPGRYESFSPVPHRGIYLMTVYHKSGNEKDSPEPVTFPFVSPYSKEYREVRSNITVLSRLAEGTGGQILQMEGLETGLKKLFMPDPERGYVVREIWWFLSLLALLLFVVDLSLRSLRDKSRAL